MANIDITAQKSSQLELQKSLKVKHLCFSQDGTLGIATDTDVYIVDMRDSDLQLGEKLQINKDPIQVLALHWLMISAKPFLAILLVTGEVGFIDCGNPQCAEVFRIQALSKNVYDQNPEGKGSLIFGFGMMGVMCGVFGSVWTLRDFQGAFLVVWTTSFSDLSAAFQIITNY